MCGANGTPLLQSPLRWSRTHHWSLHPFLILSRRHLRRPWGRDLVHLVVVVSSFLQPPISQLHLQSKRLSGLGLVKEGGGTPRTHPSPGTHLVDGNGRKTEGTCNPCVEGGA